MSKSTYFFLRTDPPGITVSKSNTLPEGDFTITEYTWEGHSLWFIDKDNFTEDERENAFSSLSLLGEEEEEECPILKAPITRPTKSEKYE